MVEAKSKSDMMSCRRPGPNEMCMLFRVSEHGYDHRHAQITKTVTFDKEQTWCRDTEAPKTGQHHLLGLKRGLTPRRAH